jgi:protein-tyrosine phosphatase
MAAAVARHLLGGDARVESAGISADDGASATKDAIRVMKERDLDISAHRSRSLGDVNLRDFDLLVAMTPEIAQALRNKGTDASKVRVLDIPDPYCKGLDIYRASAVAIERDLRRLFDASPEEPRRP